MNYLAHLYLSGNDPQIMVGNFIGDHVKGKQYNRFPEDVQTGILLHRHIDTYTDAHPAFRESINVFRGGYRRYAGVVGDIVYDHLLAAHWQNFSAETLPNFVSRSHKILMRNYFILPLRVKQFLPFLIKSRRLENYQHLEGLERTLKIMSANSSLPENTSFAIAQMTRHYNELLALFSSFMTDIIISVDDFLRESGRCQSLNHAMIS